MRRLLLVFPAAALLACGGGGGNSPPQVLPMFPDVAGDWHSNGTVTQDNCGTNLAGTPTEVIVRVAQATSDLNLQFYDVCGDLFVGGTGSVTEAGTVSYRIVETVPVDPTCALQVTESGNATLNAGRDQASGTFTDEFATLPGCAVSFSCTLQGSFVIAKCPPADCSFEMCQTGAPSRRLPQILWERLSGQEAGADQ